MASRVFLKMFAAQAPLHRIPALRIALTWPNSRLEADYATYRPLEDGHFEQVDITNFGVAPLQEAEELLSNGTSIGLGVTSKRLMISLEFVTEASPEFLTVAWTNRTYNDLSQDEQTHFHQLLKDMFIASGATCAFMTDEAVAYMEDRVEVDGSKVLIDPCYPDGSLLLIERIWTRKEEDLVFLQGR